MKTEKKSALADLQAAIKKQIKPAAAAPSVPVQEETTTRPVRVGKKSTSPPPAPAVGEGRGAPPHGKPLSRSGKGVQFYLDDADRKLIANLAVWFGSQDRRVSDSQVIKAAIRLASVQSNAKLLEICDEVRATDRRRHTRKPKRTAEAE